MLRTPKELKRHSRRFDLIRGECMLHLKQDDHFHMVNCLMPVCVQNFVNYLVVILGDVDEVILLKYPAHLFVAVGK
jgi:hypothetical protein